MATFGVTDNTSTYSSLNLNLAAATPAVSFPGGTITAIKIFVANRFTDTAPDWRWAIYSGGASNTDPTGATLVYDGSRQQTLLGNAGGGEDWVSFTGLSEIVSAGRLWVVVKSADKLKLYLAQVADANDFASDYRDLTSELGTTTTTAFPSSLAAAGSDGALNVPIKAIITYTPAAGAPTITSINGNNPVPSSGNVTIIGTDFEGSGNDTVTVSPADDSGNSSAETLTVNSGNGTSLDVAVTPLGNFADGQTLYLFVDNGSAENGTGHQFTRADETAPTLGNVAVDSPTTTGGNLSFSTTDDDGTAYWTVQAQGEAGNATQVQAGEDTNGNAALDSGNVTITVSGNQTLATVSGLSANTTYTAAVVHVDGNSNVSTVAIGNFTTAASDTTPPTISSLTVPSPTTTGGNITINTDTAEGYVVWTVTAQGEGGNQTQTLAQQDTNGNAALDSGNVSISASGNQTLDTIAGLSGNTTYTLSAVHVDASDNASTVASGNFTTSANPSMTFTLGLNTDSVIASDGNITIAVHADADDTLVERFTGQSTDANGNVTISSGNFATSTDYYVTFKRSNGRRGISPTSQAS